MNVNEELESYLMELEQLEVGLSGCKESFGQQLGGFIQQLEGPSRKLAENLLGSNYISTDTYFSINRNIDHLKQICGGMTSCTTENDYQKTTTLINHKLGLLKLNLASASEFGKKAAAKIQA